MKHMHWHSVLFWIIILLAIVLRTYNLGTVPPGVNRDEAAIGYTAYSIAHTGNDEYGRLLPISFQSFGDWKLPVYIYETIITVSLFGLNTIAVRLPSVIAGVISVILTYFLVKELFGKRSAALLAMLLLAISPWSLHLSRVSSEANTSMCIVLGGVLLILKGIKKNNWFIIPGALLLALSFGTYASNYVFTPLLVIGLCIIYRKELFHNKYFLPSSIIFILIGSMFWWIVTSANTVKLSGTGIFGNPIVVKQEIDNPRSEHGNSLGVLFHNKAVFATERFIQNYLNAFSPNFLFIQGGTNGSHNIKNFGNMYLIESLFFLLGLVFLLTQKKTKSHYFVLFWLLIGPVAASLTKDAPHTVRMFAIFPIPMLITAFGILWFFQNIQKKFFYATVTILALLYIVNISVYFDRYYVHFPMNESQNWGIGYEKLLTEVSQENIKNKNIIMANPADSPYIFFLFYGNYNPQTYQKESIRYPMTDEGFVHVKGYSRFTFKDINWEEDLKKPNTILISKTVNLPPYIKKYYQSTDVLLPSGEPLFTLIPTDQKPKLNVFEQAKE